MNKKISIIVPIYNCEKYIERCVTSLIQQTYENIEIILIDDGSTDNSYNVCNKLSKLDKRIKLYHKTNNGVSSARNYGINVCEGNYICFVDSDDWVDRKYCEILLKGFENNVDLSVIGIKPKYDFIEEKVEYENCCEIFDKSQAYKQIFKNKNFFGFPVNKMYKKRIIQKIGANVFNEEIYACEDTLFNARYIEKCSKISYNPTQLYFYYQRPGSATKINSVNEKNLSVFKALDELEKIYKKNSSENLVYLYVFYMYNYYLINIKIMRSNSNFKLKIKKIPTIYKYIMKSKKIKLKEKYKIFVRYRFPKLNDKVHYILKRIG